MEFDGEKKTQAPNTQILTDQHQQKDTFMTLRWVFFSNDSHKNNNVTTYLFQFKYI